MSRTIKIYCVNTSEYVDVEGGATLAEIAATLSDRLPAPPVCARVNNKTEPLDFAVYQPKMVEFQDATAGSGPRVCVRSLCMMLYRAVCALMPGAKLRIEHSIAKGYFCKLDRPCNEADALALKAEMKRLADADIPFERKQMLTADVIEIFRSQGLDDKVKLLTTTHPLYTTFYTIDGIADSYYGALVPSTGYLKVFDLLPYHDGLLLLGPDADNHAVPATPIVQEKMFGAFTAYLDFNRIIGVHDVGQLNEQVERRRAADIINVAEALHEKSIARISEDIAARYAEGGARIVLIAGPSSSGKTTTTKRLAIQLMTNLLKPQLISLDDYFVDRVRTPRDADGDYDYESLYALDLEQFNADLNAILAGKEVELPSYSFELGKRQYKGTPVTSRRRLRAADRRHPRTQPRTYGPYTRKSQIPRVCIGSHHPEHRRPQLGADNRQQAAAPYCPRLQIPRNECRRHHPPLAQRAPWRREMDIPLSGERRRHVQLIAYLRTRRNEGLCRRNPPHRP